MNIAYLAQLTTLLVAAIAIAAAIKALRSARRHEFDLALTQQELNRTTHERERFEREASHLRKRLEAIEQELYVSQECLCIVETRANAQGLENDRLKQEIAAVKGTVLALRTELSAAAAATQAAVDAADRDRNRATDLERTLETAHRVLSARADQQARLIATLAELQATATAPPVRAAAADARHDAITARLADLAQLLEQIPPLAEALQASASRPQATDRLYAVPCSR